LVHKENNTFGYAIIKKKWLIISHPKHQELQLQQQQQRNWSRNDTKMRAGLSLIN